MLKGLGHTNGEPTGAILGPVTNVEEDGGHELATNCGEGERCLEGWQTKMM